MKTIKINNRNIGQQQKPFIIAEMSANHNQSLERALEIVDAAADAGADAIKLQTFTPKSMTIKGALTINDDQSLWKGKGLFELYQKAQTPWEWHPIIFERAASRGIIAFSSPFDAEAVDFLESLHVPAYKIASFENTDHPLLIKVAQTGKPIIMSTGVSQLSDIDESVRVLKENGCKDLILLKCTSTYPAHPSHSNLATIPHLQQMFDDVQIGLSDHTQGIGVPIAAVALGATVIEKHFTLNRSDGGLDSAFSLEPQELRLLCTETERAALSIGKVTYGIRKNEQDSKKFKRSIYATHSIKKGEALTDQNTKVIRPGFGLEPKFYTQILGRPSKTDIKAGTPLAWDMI